MKPVAELPKFCKHCGAELVYQEDPIFKNAVNSKFEILFDPETGERIIKKWRALPKGQILERKKKTFFNPAPEYTKGTGSGYHEIYPGGGVECPTKVNKTFGYPGM